MLPLLITIYSLLVVKNECVEYTLLVCTVLLAMDCNATSTNFLLIPLRLPLARTCLHDWFGQSPPNLTTSA